MYLGKSMLFYTRYSPAFLRRLTSRRGPMPGPTNGPWIHLRRLLTCTTTWV